MLYIKKKAGGKRMRILIVDDNPKVKCKWVKEVLSEKHIMYDICTCICDALKTLYENTNKYQALILDMELPVCKNNKTTVTHGGIEILKKIEKRDIIIPTIINSTMYLKDEDFEGIKGFYGIIPIFSQREFLKNFISQIS